MPETLIQCRVGFWRRLSRAIWVVPRARVAKKLRRPRTLPSADCIACPELRPTRACRIRFLRRRKQSKKPVSPGSRPAMEGGLSPTFSQTDKHFYRGQQRLLSVAFLSVSQPDSPSCQLQLRGFSISSDDHRQMHFALLLMMHDACMSIQDIPALLGSASQSCSDQMADVMWQGYCEGNERLIACILLLL